MPPWLLPEDQAAVDAAKKAAAPTPAPKPAVAPKSSYKQPPPPKLYYFQGRAYTTQAGYQAAVAAANAATVAAAAARARAAQAAELAKVAAAQRAANQAKLQAYQKQAAMGALARSRAIRAKAEAEKQARMRAEFERVANVRKQAASRELLSAQGPRALQGMQTEMAEVARRQAESSESRRIETARTRAYEALKQRAQSAFRQGINGPISLDNPNVAGQHENPVRYRRQTLLKQAETTGNWSNVIADLQRQSMQTKGRVVDTEMLATVYEEYVGPISEVRDNFSELVADLNAAEAADDAETLNRLVSDPKNIALYEQFIELFGDGTRPGSFTEHNEILAELSRAREQAWAVQMGARAQARGGLQRNPLSAKSGAGTPARGRAEMEERFADLEYTEQVLDPNTGRMVKVTRTGMDAWLAKQQAREFVRVQEWETQRGRQDAAFRMLMEAEGHTFLGYDQDGKRVVRDNALDWQATQIRRWMPQWPLNENGIPQRIAAAADNPGVQEDLIRRFMNDAATAWDRENADRWPGFLAAAEFKAKQIAEQLAATPGARGGQVSATQIARAEQQRAKTEWLSAVARQLNKPGWSQFDQQSAHGTGVVAQGALTAMSVAISLIRDRLQKDFGDYQPHVDIGGLTPWDDASIQVGRTVDPNAAAARDALAKNSPFEDLGAWASVIRDNAMWGSGNLGGLLTQLTDPLMFAGTGRFTQAGALAIARAGGVRGIKTASLAGAGRLAKDYARYVSPRLTAKVGGKTRTIIGGAGRDVVKVEFAKLKLASKVGLSPTDALKLSDDDFRKLADDLANNRAEELLKSDILESMSQAAGIEKNQLLNMVQLELPSILREFKIFAEDPFVAAARMRDVRRAAVRAASQAETAAQMATMRAERAVAMRALADITGRVLKPSRLTAKEIAKHETLLKRYTQAAQEYLAVAERGANAAAKLEAGVANARDLRGLQAQLKDAVQQIKQYEDSFLVNPHGIKQLDREGLVSRRFRELTEFRGGADPLAPSFVDASMQQLRYDERRIRGMIRDTLRELKATPLGTKRSDLVARQQKLEKARRGLVYERAMLDEGRTLMRPYARKNFSRIERSITPQRIAPIADGPEQLAVETGRDYMRALSDAEVRELAPLTAKQEAALVQLRADLPNAPFDVAREVGDAFLDDAVRAFGKAPGLQESWTTLRMAYADPLEAARWGGALKRLDTLMVTTARRAGFEFPDMNVRQAADQLWEILKDDHSRLLGGEELGAKLYRELDAKVEAALVEWRKSTAEGQVRLKERRFNPPADAKESVFHDTDPFELLVKQRVLAEEGVSIFAYDEMRGVLRRPMLRQNAAAGIARRAIERVARTGIDMDEALKLERAETARVEVLRNVEEFATRPDMQGLPPEARLRAFEEKMMQDDLPEAAQYTISPYQERLLRSSFAEELGFSFDDKHLIARYYRGEMVAMPAGARAPRHGEFLMFDEAEGINIWVVPRDHAKLADDIPFGRPRGGADDELMALNKRTQRLAFLYDEGAEAGGGEISKEAAEMMRGWDELLDDTDAAAPGARTLDEDITELAPPRESARDADGALSEAESARRGAAAGQRQNAAVEARRSTRRNFEARQQDVSEVRTRPNDKAYGRHERSAPDGWESDHRFVEFPIEAVGESFEMAPDAYRRWLWNQMQTSQEMRDLLIRLRNKQIVYSDGIKAQILADAVNWMKTPQAREMFSPKPLHVTRPELGMANTRAQMLGQLGQYEEALRVARQIAEHQHRTAAPAEWLVRIEDALEAKIALVKRDVYGYKAGDLADLDKKLAWVKAQRAKTAKTGRVEAATSDWHRLDEFLVDEGIETIDQLMGSKEAIGRWHIPADQAGSLELRRVTALKWKVDDIRAAIKKLDADDGAPRHRGRVGLSVQGDGIFIAEGTSNVTVAHEMFHQFWDDAHNAAWVSDINHAMDLMSPELRTQLWSTVRIGKAAYDPAEFAAEMYALWRVGEDVGSDVVASWTDLRSMMMTVEDKAAFDRMGQMFADHTPRVVDTVSAKLNFPPTATPNRARLIQWYQDRGFFSPRTGEAIREGEHVWTVAQERKFHLGFSGYEAPWTDPDALKVVLNDGRLLHAALREWGFFEDDFEQVAAGLNLQPEQVADAMIWGREGLKRQRTVAELRDWAQQRYGELVWDGSDMIRMPWLMKADSEYLGWTSRFFDDALGQGAGAVAAKDKLPDLVRQHLFDGDNLRAAGIQIDPRLVKAAEIEKLRTAITAATRRRIQRMIDAGDVEPGEWLAQEQLRFAYDVTDQLLVDPVWRGWLRGTPVAGQVLHVWGQFWRMLVSWSPAFPIMNLIEAYGFKRLYLAVYQGGMRPLSLDADGLRILPGSTRDVLSRIGSESHSVFHLSEGSPWARVNNKNFTLRQRGSSLGQAIREIPIRISKEGEDHLRTDFARRVAGDTYRSARRTGMDVENAEWLARHEAKRLVDSFFAISTGNSWIKALNEIVPFFSYNFKNKTLAFRMLWNHPSVWVWGERIRREVEAANREFWAQEHPDLPFPTGPSASWLWWQVGDQIYKIDLSAFSDWTRALAGAAENHTPVEWLTEFLRVPHPSQTGALAMFTGNETPWGKPGHIRELSIWADLFYWTNGEDYADPRQRRDLMQIMSKMLFFKEFGNIGPLEIKQQTFFALRQLSPEKARQYLEANPDLQAYWDSLPARDRIKGFDPIRTISKFTDLMTKEQKDQYFTAMDGLSALNAVHDAKIAEFAATPWSDEYRAAKRAGYLARERFLWLNPILRETWGMWMTPTEFAAFYENGRVDALQDAWYNWQRPQREDFKSEALYYKALLDFNERRAAFLEAHPALMTRLSEGRTAVESAYREQELHWTEVLDFQARLKLRILNEEAKGDDTDWDMIDLLYRASDFAGAELDAERFGVFEAPVTQSKGFFASIPGFSDLLYARATPEERKEMDHNAWYARGMKAIDADSGKEFYEQLFKDPKLTAEYWKRNPDKKATYDTNQVYVDWMGRWVEHLKVRNFDAAQAVWDQMPAWVKERYFLKHPDSKMRDGGGGSSTAVEYEGKWFKSPESRDRYIAYIKGGGTSSEWPEWGSAGTFRSPESRQRFLDGQAYYAAMQQWVKLLETKDYVAADEHFKALPAWMKDKYYAKHPDQRARAELDSEALRHGAEYFLAQGDERLKVLKRYPALGQWLKDNGGDEGAMRGLINAMYRAIPSSEPWLKRTFREKFPEIFSKEAAGERALKGVAAELAEHPEMAPFFEEALKLQQRLFLEQLKHSKVQPRQWTMERIKRNRKAQKRRAARMHSRWSLHRDIRRYAGA